MIILAQFAFQTRRFFGFHFPILKSRGWEAANTLAFSDGIFIRCWHFFKKFWWFSWLVFHIFWTISLPDQLKNQQLTEFCLKLLPCALRQFKKTAFWLQFKKSCFRKMIKFPKNHRVKSRFLRLIIFKVRYCLLSLIRRIV